MDKKRSLRTPKYSKQKPRFTVPSNMKQRINALLGAGVVLGGLYGLIKDPIAVHAHSNNQSTTRDSSYAYTLGIASDNAFIKVNGQNIKIDPNSFVIISADGAHAFDENGNLLRGTIDQKDFKELIPLTEEQMNQFTVYQVIANSRVNVRSSPEITDTNKISTVPSYDFVLGLSKETPEYDGEWIPTLSVNGDAIYDGYIREDLLQERGLFEDLYDNSLETTSNLEITMMVDTSMDDNISLKLRASPEINNDNIILQIPNGSLVNVTGKTIEANDRNWSYVKYKTSKDNIVEGWVASNYLSSDLVRQPEIKTNASGSVTGIDISSMTPENLRNLLGQKIPENVNSEIIGNVNTSKVSGDINFVYIKLGASSYSQEDLQIIDYDKYIEQVKICEELGVPYGFYYYSTSKTIAEANMELECIKSRMENLKNEIDMQNNKMGMVIDIELHDKNDRQYHGIVEQQTEAKAALINGVQEQGISDNVLIYGPARVMRYDDDQIVNLQYLHSLLSNPNHVNFWLCSPITTNGNPSKHFKKDVQSIENQGFNIVAQQVVLDAKINGGIDINTIELDYMKELFNYEKDTLNTSIDSSRDNGR